MRLFVAVPVPTELRNSLVTLEKEIEQDGIKLVKPENMHLTLKFIGEVNEAKAAEIKDKLKNIRFTPINCSLKSVGVFPNENYIKVVWVGCESKGGLETLAKDIMNALHKYGDTKPFSAHLTIARVKRKINLSEFIQKHKGENFGEFQVNEFQLIKSVLTPNGPKYTLLAVFKANNEVKKKNNK